MVCPCHQVRSFLPWKSCVRRSAASWSPESVLNHTRLPAVSKIIGPCSPGPRNGAANRWAGTLPAAAGWWTITAGGCIWGSEWKLWMSAGVPRVVGNSVRGTATGRATLKWVESTVSLPLAALSLAHTVTCSPGVNGLEGTKLAPAAEEYERSRPAWRPLLEPTTAIELSAPADAPRKLICVAGMAVGVPGCGERTTDR